ncbi:MAG: hypothetical protein KDA85_21190, partial [Planctomycetaceae bacterium]|nr:hypothetical protein [Planctomycetaceae bacterium]
DYLIVSVWLNRPHLTWLTFPILIAVGCWLTVLLTDSATPELRATAMNVIDVTEVDGKQNVCVRAFTSISSRSTRRADVGFSIQIPGLEELAETTTIPFARAENVYGGMYRPHGSRLSQESFLHQPATEGWRSGVRALPMPAQGSHAFLTEGWSAGINAPLVESELVVTSNGLLEGSFTSRLPVPLRDWFVVYGSRAYQPQRRGVQNPRPAAGDEAGSASTRNDDDDRALMPGEVCNRERSLTKVTELRSFLSSTRATRAAAIAGGQSSGVSAALANYDVLNDDPVDIMMMLSLYSAAGGVDYTRVHNDQLRRMEVSDSIRLNQVLLIGLIDLPVTTVYVDEQPVEPLTQTTVVRLILPVEQVGAIVNNTEIPPAE